MFELTADEIALLNDEDLRSLVGRLCEAEMRRRDISPSCVTWGGNQRAADGGLDVRVALPSDVGTHGFIPRRDTGFQVKADDIPPAKISSEMRPKDCLRATITELTEKSGAYIIVSSKGSTSDLALQNRREAMTKAISDLPNAASLHVDFYDRKRLETWLRDHPGQVPWVREKIGKPLHGWHSFGAWAYPAESLTSDYLLDDALRVRTGAQTKQPRLGAIAGLESIRGVLRNPHGIVRLTGLSGVGKTRLAQALFDGRIGQNSLDPSLALYTNLGDGPNPQPLVVAAELISSGNRAVLVIDNCPADLHRRLSEVCRADGSKLSVLTIEYDIREDQPEGTDVFALEPSSDSLIEQLVKHRFQGISPVDARRIAEFSGGNARIAIALAATIENAETIAQLTDYELFARLFEQRHQPDEALLRAAQALSLVYSFEGENVSNDESVELAPLGTLIAKDAQEMFKHSAELERRGLIQRRGRWRAVLPQAIANRLASTALQNIPSSVLEACFFGAGRGRLLKSFCRRLGYLNGSREAQSLVTKWLTPDGWLDNLHELSDEDSAFFQNIAPVVPEETLKAIERQLLKTNDPSVIARSKRYLNLIRTLAYDPALFDRCATLIVKVATSGDVGDDADEAKSVFASLFPIILSGTHATVEQRLAVVRPLLLSEDAKHNALGIAALKALLEAWNFGPGWDFEFGGHSRDYGYLPGSTAEVKRWFAQVISFAEHLACSDRMIAPKVRDVVAGQFRGLWTRGGMHDELEHLCRAVSGKLFWKEGWIAVRQTAHFDSKDLPVSAAQRLASLQELLRPKDLEQRVRAMVTSEGISNVGSESTDDNGDVMKPYYRMQTVAESLGREVAGDENVFENLLPELFGSHELLWNFGRGLAQGTTKPPQIWDRLAETLAAPGEVRSNIRVLHGFLNGLHAKDPVLADNLLENALQDERLAPVYPVLQTAVGIDEKGFQRLLRSLDLGKSPIRNYYNLVGGGLTHSMSGRDFNTLLLRIATVPGGVDIAIEILCMRISYARDQSSPSELIEIGCALMRRLGFSQRNPVDEYRVGIVARHCLIGEMGASATRDICANLRDAVSRSETYAFYHTDLLKILFAEQPLAALEGLCGEGEADLQLGGRILDQAAQMKRNSFDGIAEAELLAWCDRQPDLRYPAIAGGVTPFQYSGDPSRPQWTSIARKILSKAPDRVAVLRKFTDKFFPMAWSGSRTAIVESNLKLLDDLETFSDAKLIDFIADEKARLSAAVKTEATVEYMFNREPDERFE